jgi:hypothetical protein
MRLDVEWRNYDKAINTLFVVFFSDLGVRSVGFKWKYATVLDIYLGLLLKTASMHYFAQFVFHNIDD